MLSAIVASTGLLGTCTNPSVAAASVMLCATVKAVMVPTSLAPSLNQNKQRQHEQQMIDAEKNVLHAQHQIGATHFQRTGRGRHHETTATME